MSRRMSRWWSGNSLDINKKARLQLLRLEDRVVPTGSLDITMLDAIGYANKTIALTLSHTGSGTSAGSIDWGDGSATTTLAGWDYATATKVFTHSYSSANTFKITATDTNLNNSDNQTLVIQADVPPAYAVDVQPGMEWSAYATSAGNNPKNTSVGMARYADGVVDLHFPDLESTGFGMPFGITRSWSNGPGYDSGSDLGGGWNINQLPTVVQVNGTNTLAIAINGNEARTFDVTTTATVYKERFFGQHQLTHDTTNHLYVLTTPGGVVYKFADFDGSWAAAAQGTFDSRTDPNGNTISVYSRSSGYITEIRRDNGSNVYESWLLAYTSNKLTSVTLRRGPNTSSYTNYRRVEYAYYGNEDHGNEGDLKTAKIYNGSDTIPISTQYWRYYKPGETSGFVGAMRMYVGFASYERADAAIDPLAASDSSLDDYADLVFQWDSSRRVTSEQVQGMGCSMCSAGVGTYTFSYTASSHGAPNGVNHWAMKTTETLPDSNQNIVYTNAYGQVMQSVQKDGSNYWRTHYVYDGVGKVTQKSNPSATTNVNESYPTLVITNGARLGIESEFQVNTYTTSEQKYPSIARDWAGNYVIAWASSGQDGSGYGVYAQRFNAVGQPQGSEFQVNTYTTNDQTAPVAAMDSDGDFVIVWESSLQDGSSSGIYAQRYNAVGQTQGSEFRVNTTTTVSQNDISVAMDASGNFVVCWTDASDGSGTGIYAQRYNSSGTAQGSEFRVNATTTYSQAASAVDMDAAGNFVVVWFSYHLNGTNTDIYGQRYNSSGTAQGSEFLVNTTTSYNQVYPGIAVDYDGDFVVTWTSYSSTGSDAEVYAQRFNSSGTAQGSEFRVNSYTTNYQVLETIACNAAGEFLVTWSSNGEDGNYYGVYGQFYMADGTASGGPFKINDYTTSHQYYQTIASDYDGNFVVTWSSAGQDSSGAGIYARPLERTYSYVSDTTGYVERYQYARVTTAGSDTTTGTGAAGDIAGFLKSTWIVQGEIDGGGNNLIKQSAQTYYLHSNGTNTVSPLATSTVYRNTDATGGQTTTMGYTFASSSLKVAEVTVTHPTVTTAQNGPNSAVVEYSKVDSYGRVTWTKDGDSRLIYREYDDATGAVKKFINDVNTSKTGDFSGSAPWSSAGSEQHLISNTTVDFMGRLTVETDPRGYSTYIFYNDPNHEVRVYPGWNGTTDKTTGPTQVYREDWDGAYTETLTMAATPNVSSHVPLGTESISSVKSLSRVQLNNAGQRIAFDEYFKLDDVTYSGGSAVLTGPSSAVRHYRTEVDYADRGGVKRTETPTGTITRYVRDVLNRVTSMWIGTDDTPTTGYWSPTNTSGADLVKVYEYTYDSGGVGDGNLTKVVADPGSAADRRTDYFYDWRNRPVAVKMGVETSESATLDTQRPIYYFDYDNLNQITKTRQYDGDNVNITITGGVPVAPGGTVQARVDTAYDELGRVYKETLYSGSSTTTFLTTDTWYDKRGNVIKTLQPGGLVTKMVYDGAGRMISIFFTNGGSDPAPGASSNWDHADDRTGDTVYEEVHYTFDSNGNVTQTTTKEREPDASGTGDLNDFDTQPYARVSYTGSYFDRANRLTDMVDVGTNGDATWAVPGSVPSRSDNELVTSLGYDNAGDVTLTTDPRGIERHDTYDALHRLTQTIEGYDDGVPSGNDDRMTTFEYDGMNHVTKRTLWLDDEEFEQTEYVYGVDVGVDGNEISSNDLLGVILYPDPETGSPSPAQYQYSYNQVGEVIRMEDINGTVHEFLFDVVGRQTADIASTLGSGIDDAVAVMTTEYDSAGRAYQFSNWTITGYLSQEGPANQVVREFNGFGQVTREYQEFEGAVDEETLYVEYGYSDSGNQSVLESMNYPNNQGYDPELAITYDAIGRPISQSYFGFDELEAVSYLGLGRIIGSQVGDGALTETQTLDRFGRITELLWENDTPAVVDNFTYGYDRDGNILYRTNELNHNFDEIYHLDGSSGYDLLNQMTRFARGELTDSKGGSGVTHVLNPDLEKEYVRDGVGNVTSITTDGGTPLDRTFDRQNRLLTHDGNGLTFDDVGNLTEDDQSNTYKYDAWNRLVGFNAETDRYAYDATGRRTKQGDRRFYHDINGNIIEEHDGDGLKYQHTWSLKGRGRPLARFHYSGGDIVTEDTVFVITDILVNVTSITTVTGAALERYVYDDHGNREFLDGEWRGGYSTSSYDWDIGWGGGRWDGVTYLIWQETITYDPRLELIISPQPPAPDKPAVPKEPPPDNRTKAQKQCDKDADTLEKYVKWLQKVVDQRITFLTFFRWNVLPILEKVLDPAKIRQMYRDIDKSLDNLEDAASYLKTKLERVQNIRKGCADPNEKTVRDTISRLMEEAANLETAVDNYKLFPNGPPILPPGIKKPRKEGEIVP